MEKIKIKINEELEVYEPLEGEVEQGQYITWKGHDFEFIFCNTPYGVFDKESQILTLNGKMPDLNKFDELNTVSKSLKGEMRVFLTDDAFCITDRAKTKVLFYSRVDHDYIYDDADDYARGMDYGYVLYDFNFDCLPFKMAKSTEVYTELFD